MRYLITMCCFFSVAMLHAAEPDWLNDGRFQWTPSGPLVSPEVRPDDRCFSAKDPTVVFYEGKFHVFATIRSENRTHQIEYLTFSNWQDAGNAKRQVLKMPPGHFCAPQVFYFTPHKKWYLICQASDPSWKEKWDVEYGAAFSTTETTKFFLFSYSASSALKNNLGRLFWRDSLHTDHTDGVDFGIASDFIVTQHDQ